MLTFFNCTLIYASSNTKFVETGTRFETAFSGSDGIMLVACINEWDDLCNNDDDKQDNSCSFIGSVLGKIGVNTQQYNDNETDDNSVDIPLEINLGKLVHIWESISYKWILHTHVLDLDTNVFTSCVKPENDNKTHI